MNSLPPDTVDSGLEAVGLRRGEAYNATLVEIIEVHESLRIFRIRLDEGPLDHLAGQYTVLGLGTWEPFAGATPPTPSADESRKLLKRAYSFSSSILDASGALLSPRADSTAEFYVTLVPATAEHPPGLTPRLFALKNGDRLFVGPRPKGNYTLAPVRPGQTVVFAATGTGEAPHNAMLAELLARGHSGKIVSLVCVRRRRDLGYLSIHRQLEERHANYRYVPLTTREPENIDPKQPGFVGKQYLQDYFASGGIDALLGGRIDPEQTHVYLCGNPQMLGLPERRDGGLAFPAVNGMAEVLTQRGFTLDEPGNKGNVHFEKYW